MKGTRSIALLLLAVGCGEPWVTLGQRALHDGAASDGSSDADSGAAVADAGTALDSAAAASDAGEPTLPSSDDSAVGAHTGDEHTCVDSTQCTSGGHPFCDTAQGMCVRCLGDLDCDSQDRCLAGDCVSSH